MDQSMKPFQSFNLLKNISPVKVKKDSSMDSHAICKQFKLWNDKIFSIKRFFSWFDSCPLLEHFGVYFDNVMYYLSTNPGINVVKHILDEGKRIKEIEQCKIPNTHLKLQETQHLQG